MAWFPFLTFFFFSAQTKRKACDWSRFSTTGCHNHGPGPFWNPSPTRHLHLSLCWDVTYSTLLRNVPNAVFTIRRHQAYQFRRGSTTALATTLPVQTTQGQTPKFQKPTRSSGRSGSGRLDSCCAACRAPSLHSFNFLIVIPSSLCCFQSTQGGKKVFVFSPGTASGCILGAVQVQ